MCICMHLYTRMCAQSIQNINLIQHTFFFKKINIKHKILYAFYDPISEKLKIKKEQEEELTCEGEGIHRTK